MDKLSPKVFGASRWWFKVGKIFSHTCNTLSFFRWTCRHYPKISKCFQSRLIDYLLISILQTISDKALPFHKNENRVWIDLVWHEMLSIKYLHPGLPWFPVLVNLAKVLLLIPHIKQKFEVSMKFKVMLETVFITKKLKCKTLCLRILITNTYVTYQWKL